MKRARYAFGALLMLSVSGVAVASEAETSAQAGSAGRRSGTAQATARYEGDVGVARTNTRSGRVSLARGLAWGLDEDGLSLSASHAVAGRFAAVARNFNLTIGMDGQVAVSGGRSVSVGPRYRTAGAGGLAGSQRGRTYAVSSAHGESDRRGVVRTKTYSRSSGRGGLVRRLRELRSRR
jgi:hypothetical protein